MGAFVVFCMVLYRGMRWPQFKGALIETAKLAIMIFPIIWGVLFYVRFLGFADLPVVYPAVMALNGGEAVSAADSAFGMSALMYAIWFGILAVKMAALCLITPPIGLNCFVVAGVRPDISVHDACKGASPFFLADALTIAGLIAFPGIVLWLPGLLL